MKNKTIISKWIILIFWIVGIISCDIRPKSMPKKTSSNSSITDSTSNTDGGDGTDGDDENDVDNGEDDPTNPTGISGMSLTNPSGTTIGNISSPTIQVDGVVIGDTITIYSDSSCMNTIQTTVVSSNQENISITFAAALPEGVYTFYAMRSNSAGYASNCSSTDGIYVEYTVDTTAPSAPNSLSMVTLGTLDPTPTILVSGTEHRTKVTLYNQHGTVVASGTVYDSSGDILLTTSTLPSEGSYTFYTKITDDAGNNATFTNVNVTYIFDPTPSTPPELSVVGSVNGYGNDDTPLIRVNGVNSGDTIEIINSDTGLILASGDVSVGSNSIDITIPTSIGADGVYIFYSAVIDNNSGTRDPFPSSNVSYTLDRSAPSVLTSDNIALINPTSSPGTIGTPTFALSNLKEYDTVRLYSDMSCSIQVAINTVADDQTSIEITIASSLTQGIHTFYGTVTSAAGNLSTCSSALTSYTYTSDSGVSVIEGTPDPTAREGITYTFTPTTNHDIDQTTFFITGMPSWATFDSSTGELTGIPDTSGTFSSITISGTYGSTTTAIGPFEITVTGDPLATHAWHLNNTGQTTYSNASAYVGQDMSILGAINQGYTGNGIKIAISDTGLEIAHEDLSANILSGMSRNYGVSPYTGGDPTGHYTDGDHGTCMAGIIGARGWNGLGSRGVAPLAGLAGFNYLYHQTETTSIDQASGADFDIFNFSYGTINYEVVHTSEGVKNQIIYGVNNYRGGKGAIYIKAAGNSFYASHPDPYVDDIYMPLNANFPTVNELPQIILVGAVNSFGIKASYSSTGSNIWVMGAGGEFGYGEVDTYSTWGEDPPYTEPAILTTDQSGCSAGFAKARTSSDLSLPEWINMFNGNLLPEDNINCNYMSSMNGSSAATATISGAVALLLEANPNLTWRDVKHILATTAEKVDLTWSGDNHPNASMNSITPSGHTYEQGWITNAGGYSFHNWYGFGRVNIEAAINMAKDYDLETLGTLTETSWEHSASNLTQTIPDNSSEGITHQLHVSSNLTIEAVQVKVSVSHSFPGDLGIELVSPSGTKSILLNINNIMALPSAYDTETGDYYYNVDFDDFVLLTNAFYNENSLGDWTLKLVDGNALDEGQLVAWSLNILGH